MKKPFMTSVGGVIAATLSSLCCIGPVALAYAGIGGSIAFSGFESFRPYFIGLTLILIGIAFFLTYRKREVQCEDGRCIVEKSGPWNKVGVWTATFITTGAIAFPYLGFAPRSTGAVSDENKAIDLTQDVSFLDVPLVCNAAPSIGCGSRAKFVMLDLMKDAAVKEAWLNREGTVMAVVWNEGAGMASRQSVLTSVFSHHNLPVAQATESGEERLAEDFNQRGMWYRGSDVDALSIIEAGVIADRIISGIKPHATFKNEEDRENLREDVKGIIQQCFLSLKSFDEFDESTYQRVENEIIAAGEKYLGKGNMPDLEFAKEECDTPEHGAGCCDDKRAE